MRAFERRIGAKATNALSPYFDRIEYLKSIGIAIDAPTEMGSDEMLEAALDLMFFDQAPEAQRLRSAMAPLLQAQLTDPIPVELRVARRAAVRLAETHEWETIVVGARSFTEEQTLGSGSDEILQVFFTALPEPDDVTPWEAIVDFRNDPESRRRFLALRHWINELIAGKRPASQLEDEVAHLQAEFEHHMKIHRIKSHGGMLETLVVAGAEVAENLLKIRWGKVAKTLFSIAKRRVELLDAERAAPGRQLAYIVEAKQRFG